MLNIHCVFILTNLYIFVYCKKKFEEVPLADAAADAMIRLGAMIEGKWW